MTMTIFGTVIICTSYDCIITYVSILLSKQLHEVYDTIIIITIIINYLQLGKERQRG